MNKKLVDTIKEEFEKIIATKTGWGKNEIMRAYDQAVSKAVLRIMDEED